jgi:hypothetical protein
LICHLVHVRYVAGEKSDLKKILALLGSSVCLFGQYSGPAILSRGDAPAAMSGSQVTFSPFLEVNGIYDNGLAGVAVNAQGDLATAASPGIQVAWGVSGAHRWRHTEIGIDYRGDINHYEKTTYYDSTDQSLMFGIKHQFSRHVLINWRNTAGTFSITNPSLGLPQTVPFDPAQIYIPTTDFFDNRTIYGSSMIDLIIQKSSRLSFDFGGGGFLTRRRSQALYGVNDETAHADVQYRLSRRSTIGADYNYTHYNFTGIFSSTDIHGFDGTYAIQLSRSLEFTGYGGVARMENKFVQDVPVDPAITAILGITSGLRVSYGVQYVPNISARLSRTVSHGVLYANGGHTITPGNGLFLTSTSTAVMGGYTYTGLRRWSFNVTSGYNRNRSIGNIQGVYGGATGSVSVSRQLSRGVHAVAMFTSQQYSSPDFSQYNRVIYQMKVGFGFTPGDVPLRIW